MKVRGLLIMDHAIISL